MSPGGPWTGGEKGDAKRWRVMWKRKTDDARGGWLRRGVGGVAGGGNGRGLSLAKPALRVAWSRYAELTGRRAGNRRPPIEQRRKETGRARE